MFSLLFGQFTNAFGSPDLTTFMATINDLALKFLYLGIGGVHRYDNVAVPHIHMRKLLAVNVVKGLKHIG
jgi:hypothetical protein